MGIDLIVAGAVLALSAALTGVARRFALARGLLDVPNSRSSHAVATPRGGGIAMVLSVSMALLIIYWLGEVRPGTLLAMLFGGGAVAAIGFLDDRWSMPAGLRLAVHGGAAIWALICVGVPEALVFGSHVLPLGWAGWAAGTVGIIWTVNLFNFMDGIDGIAASESAFVACGGAALTLVEGGAADVVTVGFLVGAACLGFLLWNWSPARIFMGDVGSGYLGYVIGVLALAAVRSDPAALWVWLILGGVFFVDATYTLLRRAGRGERLHQAHRSHAYQRLSRRWQSHEKVTLAVIALNLLWLFPCAIAAVRYPALAVWIAAGALVPVVAVVALVGSGCKDAS